MPAGPSPPSGAGPGVRRPTNRLMVRVRSGTRMAMRLIRNHPVRILLIAGALIALTAPLALSAGEGDPIRGGERNPSPDRTKELTDETEIIAETDEYGTRQSNKGTGGGAIYGCRTPRARSESSEKIACVRANNLRDGRAFSFSTGGPVAGEIEVGDPASQPFATNGRGKVENLNSDMVDSTNLAPMLASLSAGQTLPQPLGQSRSLTINMACGADGDITITATTNESGIIHGLAHGIAESQDDWEDKDDQFNAGETFTTGFDQSHSGFLRYVDDDEAVTVDLSTDEQGGDPARCLEFGSFAAGPHAVPASIASP